MPLKLLLSLLSTLMISLLSLTLLIQLLQCSISLWLPIENYHDQKSKRRFSSDVFVLVFALDSFVLSDSIVQFHWKVNDQLTNSEIRGVVLLADFKCFKAGFPLTTDFTN